MFAAVYGCIWVQSILSVKSRSLKAVECVLFGNPEDKLFHDAAHILKEVDVRFSNSATKTPTV